MRLVHGTIFLLASNIVCSGATAQDDGWTSWQLVSRGNSTENVDGWVLMLHPDGRLSSSWVGPMYSSEKDNALVALEGLEAMGTYQRSQDTIVLRIPYPPGGGGWLWSWSTVRCRVDDTATSLNLTHCMGSGAARPDASGLQEPDMTFSRLD